MGSILGRCLPACLPACTCLITITEHVTFRKHLLQVVFSITKILFAHKNHVITIGTLIHMLISNGFRVFSLSLASNIPANLSINGPMQRRGDGSPVIKRSNTQECFGLRAPMLLQGFTIERFKSLKRKPVVV